MIRGIWGKVRPQETDLYLRFDENDRSTTIDVVDREGVWMSSLLEIDSLTWKVSLYADVNSALGFQLDGKGQVYVEKELI